jgi:hypothetical protein
LAIWAIAHKGKWDGHAEEDMVSGVTTVVAWQLSSVGGVQEGQVRSRSGSG